MVMLLSINCFEGVYPEETVTFHPQGATMTGVLGILQQPSNIIHL